MFDFSPYILYKNIYNKFYKKKNYYFNEGRGKKMIYNF